MQQQADTIFILTDMWGTQRTVKGKMPEWSESNRKKWEQCIREGHVKLKKENAERQARNEPPRVLDEISMVRAYFPDLFEAVRRPDPPYYYYTARDFAKSLQLLREENASQTASKSGISKRKKDEFFLNVILFEPVDNPSTGSADIFKKMTSLCNGRFRSIAGLEAIKSSATQ